MPGDTVFSIFLPIFSIIILDLVLSGDNAAVIGMAICRLPPDIKKKAAICGTFFAIVLRIIFTSITALILNIPFLRFFGGILLLFITYKLIKAGNGEQTAHIQAKNGFYQAVGIIVLADLSMAFDNVLAVAGAAHGNLLLVVFGLLCSIPILVFASTWLSNLMDRYPLILFLGGAVLINTSLDMILTDAHIDFSGRFGIPYQYLSISIAVFFFAFNTWKLMRERV